MKRKLLTRKTSETPDFVEYSYDLSTQLTGLIKIKVSTGEWEIIRLAKTDPHGFDATRTANSILAYYMSHHIFPEQI